MAKDPALLWYWNDWAGGTSIFSPHLKGLYMDLLHAQFNNGPLSLLEIKHVLAQNFDQCWPTLARKFEITEDGKFKNKRLETEADKRKNYTKSRRNNLAGSKLTLENQSHMEGYNNTIYSYNNNISKLDNKIAEFFIYRIKIKKPILDVSKPSFIKKLTRYSEGNEEAACEILDTSIANSWQGIFRLSAIEHKKATSQKSSEPKTIEWKQ